MYSDVPTRWMKAWRDSGRSSTPPMAAASTTTAAAASYSCSLRRRFSFSELSPRLCKSATCIWLASASVRRGALVRVVTRSGSASVGTTSRMRGHPVIT
eukprot:1184200-Prorocentrum_minimum.AAC.2